MTLGGSCPTPLRRYDRIVLGHGSGGRLTADLVAGTFAPTFPLEDQATLAIAGAGGARIQITTDSFVVSPVFFPGGDIGRLAVCGTVNDLAVGGARPTWLSAAFILEEGLLLEELERVVASMSRACEEAGVTLVTGDTKVVDRGKGDRIFITTTGVGVVPESRTVPSVGAARPGDRVIVSGTLGDHGVAILSVREGIAFDTVVESDVAPLGDLAAAAFDAGRIHCMRDPTRGGLSSTLNEIAVASGVGIVLDENALPVRPAVAAACEMLGLDPLYVANEGKLVAVVPPDDAERVLAAMRAHPRGADAAIVGDVIGGDRARARLVTLRSRIGGERVVPMLAGEQLPRIC